MADERQRATPWATTPAGWRRVVVYGLGLLAPWLAAADEASLTNASAARTAKLYVDAPGVYAIGLDTLSEAVGWPSPASSGGFDDLGLTHRGEPIPCWRGAGSQLVFVVPSERFARPHRTDGAAMIVLLLTRSDGVEPLPAVDPPIVARPPDRSARVERARIYERDLSRAPLDLAAAQAGVESFWYWTLISQRASSSLTIELGTLDDRAPGADLVVTLDLLGWSAPKLPPGVSGHRVDVRLDDEPIGTLEWDGRRAHRAELVVPPTTMGERDTRQLTVKIPTRRSSADDEPIVDLAYVDRVEVRYPAAGRLVDGASPLRIWPEAQPRLLTDPSASRDAMALTVDGMALSRDASGRWIVPAAPDDADPTELWIVEPHDVREPLAIEPATRLVGPRSPTLDYLMIAPPDLMPGARRLAALRRSQGWTVEVVDVVAIYDAFGAGEKTAGAIRRFLDATIETASALRAVLLVGDADGWIAEDTTPLLAPRPTRRDRVPTFVTASGYGPAANDHGYAADPADPASPRFAVGRLPVIDAAELDRVVDKLVTHAEAPAPSDRTLLLTSDRTQTSTGWLDRLSRRLDGQGFDLVRVDDRPTVDLDVVLLGALDRGPSVVYFRGHGSRHQWQLGPGMLADPRMAFDRQDVARLAPADRWPLMLSISCATAPFDHPTADSLGEALVLAPRRGAIAFLGAGVRLYTPPAFSEALIRALATEPTIGDAVTAAKRSVGRAHVSELYNLLGDPATRLR